MRSASTIDDRARLTQQLGLGFGKGRRRVITMVPRRRPNKLRTAKAALRDRPRCA